MTRSLLLAAAFGLTAATAHLHAQLPDFAYAEDVQMTTIDGEPIGIHAWLDSGYTVVVDAMAVWCPPCWSYHRAGVLKDVYRDYGPDGTDEMRVVMVEADATTPEDWLRSDAGRSLGDWTAGTPYPIVNDDAFNAAYRVNYFPTIYLITPTRTVHEVGQLRDPGAFARIARSFPAPSEEPVAVVVAAEDRPMSQCAGTPYADLVLHNVGTEAVTNVEVRAVVDDGVAATVEVPDGLAPYRTQRVRVELPDAVRRAHATTNIHYEIAATGAAGTVSAVSARQLRVGATPSRTVTVEITLDGQPTETIWGLFAADGTQLTFKRFIGSDANATVRTTFELPGDGCYELVLLDTDEDGMLAYAPGADPLPGVRVLGPDGFVVVDARASVDDAVAGDRFDELRYGFYVDASVSDAGGVAWEQLGVYPNPTQGAATLTGLPDGELRLELYDATGRRLRAWRHVGSVDALDLTGYAPGLYRVVAAAPDGQRAAATVTRIR